MTRVLPLNQFGPAFIKNVFTAIRVKEALETLVGQELARMTFPPQIDGHDVWVTPNLGGVAVKWPTIGKFNVVLTLNIDLKVKYFAFTERHKIRADVPFSLEVITMAPLMLSVRGGPVLPSAIKINRPDSTGSAAWEWGQIETKMQSQIADGINKALDAGMKTDVLALLKKQAPCEHPLTPGRIDYPTFGTEFIRHAISRARLKKEISNEVRALAPNLRGSKKVGPATATYTIAPKSVEAATMTPNAQCDVLLSIRINLDITAPRLNQSYQIDAQVTIKLQVSAEEPLVIVISFYNVGQDQVSVTPVNLSPTGIVFSTLEKILKTEIANGMAAALKPKRIDVVALVQQALGTSTNSARHAPKREQANATEPPTRPPPKRKRSAAPRPDPK